MQRPNISNLKQNNAIKQLKLNKAINKTLCGGLDLELGIRKGEKENGTRQIDKAK